MNTMYLKQGMYVSSLDRPWLDTPFLIQGFLIRDDEEIRTLQKFCDFVYIDTDRGIGSEHYMGLDPGLPSNTILDGFLNTNVKNTIYKNKKTTEQEMPTAKLALEDASGQISDLMEGVKAGKNLNITKVKSIVEPVISSIVRNPDAMMWLMQLRKKDDYTYLHSVDNCALAIAFGRHMGLPKEELRTVSIGMLLLDIGKMKLPDKILNKTTTLTEQEYREAKRHVDYGVEILRHSQDFNDDVINIVLTHHERMDGSGYPNALIGKQIPVYGRMAAIIDCFDAMISKRPYSEPMAQHQVLQKIYNWRDKYFQAELVEQFLQCIGVYPTGSLVEMSTGEVGIVLSQNKTRRLRPKVMMVLGQGKQPLLDQRIVDLGKQLTDKDGNDYHIITAHDPGSFGIEPSDYYL